MPAPTFHKTTFVSIIIGFTVLLVCFGHRPAAANDQRTVYGVAIDGYDPVAYFTDAAPVKGTSVHYYDWNDARWYFSKAENRDRFAANPKKYAPSHAGF